MNAVRRGILPAPPSASESMLVPAGAASRAPRIDPEQQFSVSDSLALLLSQLGVKYAFGVFGGAIAPFCKAIDGSDIELLHFHHEAGAAFAAIESSIANDTPVVVFATTGPGVTNLITGIAAARWEGAKVIFVSGSTPARQRGRWAFQETSNYTASAGTMAAPMAHYVATMEHPDELPVIAARLTEGVQRKSGFVAHIALPISTQTAPASGPTKPRYSSMAPPACDAQLAADCVELLARRPFVIWAGFGARHAAKELLEFAEKAGVTVMCSPRAKGLFPEDHPQYLGVTGFGGHAGVDNFVSRMRPDHVLVLGSRLSEFTSFWSQDLVPERSFIHVDVDAHVFGASYPEAITQGVQAEVGAFLRAMLEAWPQDVRHPQPAISQIARAPHEARATGPVRSSFLMQAIQRRIVDRHESIVLTEAGNAFALGTHYLRFREAGRYRVSTGFGSMGHAGAGVLGASLASGQKAVAILGDGSMLMLNEINTAAQYGIDAVWIVLNDARYGMIEQGMQSLKWDPFETTFPRADFVAIARGMKGDGIAVHSETDVDDALDFAMASRGPFVVDVIIDPTEIAPATKRNQSLVKQGVNG